MKLLALLTALAVVITIARAETPAPKPAPPETPKIATFKTSANIEGYSFKKGETFRVEKIDRTTATAQTTRNGRPYRIPLTFIELADAPSDEAAEAAARGTVVITKAQYGPPGGRQSNVINKVRALASQTAPGKYPSILVSAALANGAGAASPVFDPASILTVTYTVDGVSRTAQGSDGDHVVLK